MRDNTDCRQPCVDMATLSALCNELRNPGLPIDMASLQYLCARFGVRGHLAILTRTYLERIVSEVKTIESRFSKPRIVPFKQIRRGDVLFLKESGGPVRAIVGVADVEFFGPLRQGEPEKIMEKYSEGLALDESFKEAKRDSKFGTLIFLSRVFLTEPLEIQKTDRRSWVILNGSSPQQQLFF